MLKKVVIPVAGLGTRVLPASKAIPKEMLCVVDKPVIQHVVEEALGAGFRDIILVTRSGKGAIEDHFDHHYELETELSRKGKTALLQSIRDLLPADAQVISVRQPKALGLGHAVLCAAASVGEEDFAVMLPDMLIDTTGASDMQRMVEAYQRTGAGQIMVEAVPQAQVERYGIVDCGGATVQAGDSVALRGLVEKPPLSQAPSNLAIVGRYILPAQVMTLLRHTPPGAGGEIQLTDALQLLLGQQPLNAFSMSGRLYDCGNKAGLVQANIAYALKHPDTAAAVTDFIQQLKL